MKITAEFEHVYEGEHGTRVLFATPDAADLQKQLRLAFRTPAGKLWLSEALTPENGVCAYPLPQVLLDGKGTLEAQLLVTDEDGRCVKSAVYPFPVEPSLDPDAVADGARVGALSALCAKVEALETRIATISEIPMELVQAALSQLRRQTDAFLSPDSENPVQNAVLTAALAQKADKTNAVIGNSVSLGRKENTTVGARSVAAGDTAEASGYAAQALGMRTTASGNYAHAEGSAGTAAGVASHAEGGSTLAGNTCAHAEGSGSEAAGTASHAEGGNSYAAGNYSHAEGNGASAAGNQAHAEGNGSAAAAASAHAEGDGTTASGESSHAEGYHSAASATAAHAEGFASVAAGVGAHAGGVGTVASGVAQRAIGKYNTEDANGLYAVIAGGGTADSARKNIGTLDWNGNAWFRGNVKIGGSSRGDVAAKTVATQDMLAAKADLSALAAVATSGSYGDLSGKPAIPTVPTKVSAFSNDAGYLTSHQSLAGLASESYVQGSVTSLESRIKDRFIINATWNSAADMVTAVDSAPDTWNLNGGKALILRLSDGTRSAELQSLASTDFLAHRRLFAGMLPSSSVMGNNNVIVDGSDHKPVLLYCFMGVDDVDPSSDTDVFTVGQRTDGCYLWISKIYRLPLADTREDYVVENGASGVWSWRKWSSGRAELWASGYEVTVGSGNRWGLDGNVDILRYYTGTVTLPFSLYDKNYSTSVTRVSGSTCAVIGGSHTSKGNFNIAYVIPGTITPSESIFFDVSVTGRWK